MDNNYAKMIAAFEQAGSMMGQFAYLLGAYHKELVQNGLTRKEALTLCVAYQNGIMKGAFAGTTPPPPVNEDNDN